MKKIPQINPKLLKAASLALFIGAFGFAWLGYSAQDPKPLPQSNVANQPVYDVWVFSRSVAKGELIQRNALHSKQVTHISNQYIVDSGQAIGKRVSRSVRQGTILTNDILAMERPIIDELPPNHRAVAIKSNEVLSVGGYLQAGDHVDIMYMLKPNKESGTTTTARRLASNVPILAIGEQLTSTDESKVDREDHARSIVLCVHESLASVILLAELTGELRLAAVGSKDLLDEPSMFSPSYGESPQLQLTSAFLSSDNVKVPSNTLPHDYTVKLQSFGPPAEKKNPKATPQTHRKTTPTTYIEIIQGGERSMVKAIK